MYNCILHICTTTRFDYPYVVVVGTTCSAMLSSSQDLRSSLSTFLLKFTKINSNHNGFKLMLWKTKSHGNTITKF